MCYSNDLVWVISQAKTPGCIQGNILFTYIIFSLWNLIIYITINFPINVVPWSGFCSYTTVKKHKKKKRTKRKNNNMLQLQSWSAKPGRGRFSLGYGVYEYLFIRVTMYRPFSKSYIVFNWGFLHFDIDQTVNINMIMMTTREGNDEDSSLTTVVIQSDCSVASKLAVLCKMNAPKAQSNGIFPTWFAYPSLF